MATKSYNGVYYDTGYDYQKDLNKLDKNAANYNSLFNATAKIRNAKIQGEGLGYGLTALLPESTSTDSPQPSVQDALDRLTKAKEDAIVAGLGKARDNALSGINAAQTRIQPMYYDKRNAAAATNQIGRRTLAEELSRRGEINSGVADEANIRANMSLQGETGLLNRQEAADIADIERRRSDAQTAYEYDLANARAGLQTASLEQQIAEMRRQQDMARDDARYADTRADVMYDRNYQQNRDMIGDQRYNQQYTDSRNDVQWERDWQTNKNNPAYAMQLLQIKAGEINNKLAQMELDNYPEEQKLKIQQLKKQIAEIGKTQPVSFYETEMQKIKLDTAKLELENLQNGYTKSGGIPSGTGESANPLEKIGAITADLDSLSAIEAYNDLKNNPSDYISEIGSTEYNRLMGIYKNKAGIE